MLYLLLFVGVWFGIVFFIVKLVNRWAAYQIKRSVDLSFRAVECIVNEGHVPDEWLQPHVRRLERVRLKGGSSAALERVQRRAQKSVLRHMDALIRFFSKEGFVDRLETKRTLLKALEAHRHKWQKENWQYLLEVKEMQA